MMNKRRNFIKHIGTTGIAIPFAIEGIAKSLIAQPLNRPDNPDWEEIRSLFLKNDYNLINLNNGSSGIMPIPVLEVYQGYLKEINSFAPYYVLNNWKPFCENHINRLGELINAPKGTIAFVRNTTEAINLVIWGKQWESDDEIICASWDYPLVEFTLQHLQDKQAVKIKKINENIHGLSDDEIITLYKNKITPKTKLIIATWITHREGNRLPVQRICQLANANNIEVLVDGAHSIGQIDVDLQSISCDYFASSLHKWLNAPLGSGILYIKEDKMSSQSPKISYDSQHTDTIVKYDYLGTRTWQNLMTLGSALDFLELTGINKKSNRLRDLNLHWINALKNTDGISIYTDTSKSCAVASMGIKNISGNKIKKIMNEKFGVHVKATSYPGRGMIRISPNIYSRMSEMDRFLEAVYYVFKIY